MTSQLLRPLSRPYARRLCATSFQHPYVVGRCFGQVSAGHPHCSNQELEARDNAFTRSRDSFEKASGKEASLGGPLDRRVFVHNFRAADGLSRVTKLQIKDSEGNKWLSLTEDDFKKLKSLTK